MHKIRQNHSSVLVNGAVNYKNGRLRLIKKDTSDLPKTAGLNENQQHNFASKIIELKEQNDMQSGFQKFTNRSGRKSHNDIHHQTAQDQTDQSDIKLPQLFLRKKDSSDFENRLKT